MKKQKNDRVDARRRRWCFTNFDMEMEWKAVQGLRYVCYGDEVSPTTQKRHQQGWLLFKNAVTLAVATSRVGGKMHMEPMRGTIEQNDKYCSKESGLTEIGDKPMQGFRVDIEEYLARVRDGVPEVELAEAAPALWAQYGRRGETLRRMLRPRRRWDTEVKVWWGKPGSGKTRAAIAWLGDDYDDVCVAGTFIVGYRGATSVLFDDFEAGTVRRGLFLRLLDRHPLRINIKYDEMEWNPIKLAVTSNFEPGDWYPGDREAVLRRISEVVHCTGVA